MAKLLDVVAGAIAKETEMAEQQHANDRPPG
jgi:hypothetical protein